MAQITQAQFDDSNEYYGILSGNVFDILPDARGATHRKTSDQRIIPIIDVSSETWSTSGEKHAGTAGPYFAGGPASDPFTFVNVGDGDKLLVVTTQAAYDGTVDLVVGTTAGANDIADIEEITPGNIGQRIVLKDLVDGETYHITVITDADADTESINWCVVDPFHVIPENTANRNQYHRFIPDTNPFDFITWENPNERTLVSVLADGDTEVIYGNFQSPQTLTVPDLGARLFKFQGDGWFPVVPDTSQPFGDAQVSVRALDLFADREVIQQTGGDFGIYTNRFHLSDDPAVVGSLQGTAITFKNGVPKDLYLVGPTVRGPGETIDQEHNGTITGIHYRVTFDGQSFEYEFIDSQRNHPTTLPDDAYLQVTWNDQAGLQNFDANYTPFDGSTFVPEILFSGLAISTPLNQYLVDDQCFLTSPVDVDDRTGLASGGDTPFTFFDNNAGTDVTYVATRTGTLTGFRMNLRNASTTDYSIDAIVRNATTGEESSVTFDVPAGDAFGAGDNEVTLTTGVQTSVGDIIEFEFSGGSADVIQRNTNDTENVFNWAFAGPINNPSMGVIYRDEVVVRWFEDDSIRYSSIGSTVAVELPNGPPADWEEIDKSTELTLASTCFSITPADPALTTPNVFDWNVNQVNDIRATAFYITQDPSSSTPLTQLVVPLGETVEFIIVGPLYSSDTVFGNIGGVRLNATNTDGVLSFEHIEQRFTPAVATWPNTTYDDLNQSNATVGEFRQASADFLFTDVPVNLSQVASDVKGLMSSPDVTSTLQKTNPAARLEITNNTLQSELSLTLGALGISVDGVAIMPLTSADYTQGGITAVTADSTNWTRASTGNRPTDTNVGFENVPQGRYRYTFSIPEQEDGSTVDANDVADNDRPFPVILVNGVPAKLHADNTYIEHDDGSTSEYHSSGTIVVPEGGSVQLGLVIEGGDTEEFEFQNAVITTEQGVDAIYGFFEIEKIDRPVVAPSVNEVTQQLAALQNQFDINSIDLTTIPDLQFDVKSGEKWVFEVNLLAESLDATADLRAGTIAPAGSTGRITFVNAENAVVRGADINAETLSLAVALGTDDLIQIKGIVNAGADGVVQFQLRNNTGTNLQSFKADSWIEAKKIP